MDLLLNVFPKQERKNMAENAPRKYQDTVIMHIGHIIRSRSCSTILFATSNAVDSAVDPSLSLVLTT